MIAVMGRDGDRIAELEGDLQTARMQIAVRVCSECPAKDRVAELEAMLQSQGDMLQEIYSAAGYRIGEAVSARGLIARLRDGDR